MTWHHHCLLVMVWLVGHVKLRYAINCQTFKLDLNTTLDFDLTDSVAR